MKIEEMYIARVWSETGFWARMHEAERRKWKGWGY